MQDPTIPSELRRLLDADGRIEYYPKKKKHLRPFIWRYLHSKIEEAVEYSESELNAIIRAWIAFDDYVTLRRDLYDHAYIDRAIDGSKYWKIYPEKLAPTSLE